MNVVRSHCAGPKVSFINALSAAFLTSIMAYLFTPLSYIRLELFKQVLNHVLIQHVKYNTFDTLPRSTLLSICKYSISFFFLNYIDQTPQ